MTESEWLRRHPAYIVLDVERHLRYSGCYEWKKMRPVLRGYAESLLDEYQDFEQFHPFDKYAKMASEAESQRSVSRVSQSNIQDATSGEDRIA